jgi:hypothetical protein
LQHLQTQIECQKISISQYDEPATPVEGLDWLVDAVGLDAEGFFLRNK